MQDFPLTRGQQLVAIAYASRTNLSNVVLHQHLADLRAEERLALAHRFDGVDQIALGRILQQISLRARFQRLPVRVECSTDAAIIRVRRRLIAAARALAENTS